MKILFLFYCLNSNLFKNELQQIQICIFLFYENYDTFNRWIFLLFQFSPNHAPSHAQSFESSFNKFFDQ